jgi:arginyl-tRNA synthetase
VRAQKILQTAHHKIRYENLVFETGEENNLIAHIITFPEIIEQLTKSYHPHVLCSYVYELTKLFSSLYANVPILSEKNLQLRDARLALL